MTLMESEHIAAPVDPVYKFFGLPSEAIVTLPRVKARRGPIVYRQETDWDERRYRMRRKGWKVRRWWRSHWWPARITDLERQVAYLTQELDDWD